MKQTLEVLNVKCGGCASTLIKSLKDERAMSNELTRIRFRPNTNLTSLYLKNSSYSPILYSSIYVAY